MPQVTARGLPGFLRRQGFEDGLQAESHLVLVCRASGSRTIVPVHPGDLGRGIALKILGDAGFTVDDYLRLR